MSPVTESRGLSLSRLALLAALATTGCGNPTNTEASAVLSCDEVLNQTIELIRAGQTGNGHDALTDSIERLRTGNCPEQYEVFADYSSTEAMNDAMGIQPCSELAQYDVHPDAVELLRQDELCSGDEGEGPVPAPRTDQSSGITWGEAGDHVGTTQRVCGPLAGTGSSADDVFWNLGRNYPDPGRFTIVLWDVGSVDAPSVGRTLCATGRITSHQGVAQIELRSPNDVEVSD